MADTPILKLEIQGSAEFEKFKTSFESYAKTLRSTVGDWQAKVAAINQATAAVNNLAGATRTLGQASSRTSTNLANTAQRLSQTMPLIQRFSEHFGRAATHSGNLLKNFMGLSVGMKGLGLTAAGVYGLEKFIQMTAALSAQRSAALGMGVSFPFVRAAQTLSPILPGAPAMVSGAAEARWNMGSAARMAMYNLYGPGFAAQINRRDETTANFDALQRAVQMLRSRAKGVDEQMLLARGLGFTDRFGEQALKAGLQMSPEDMDRVRKQAELVDKANKESEHAVKQWAIFNATLQASKSVIEATLVRGLVPLAKPFGQFSQDFADFLRRATPLMAPFAEGLGDVVKVLDKTVKAMDPVLDALRWYKHKIDGLLPTTPKVDKLTPAVPLFVPWLLQHLPQLLRHRPPVPEPGRPPGPLGHLPWSGAPVPDVPVPRLLAPPPPRSAHGPQQTYMGAPAAALAAASGGNWLAWVRQWFQTESAATRAATRSAESRDTEITILMGSLTAWFTAAAPREQALLAATTGLKDWLDKAGAGGAGAPYAPGQGPTGAARFALPPPVSPAIAELTKRGFLGGATPRTTARYDMTGATRASGNLKKNQDEAYAAAKAAGLSDPAASALVANMSGEALAKPGDVHWDVSHYAHGIVQWDDVRSKRIAAQFGQSPEKMSVADQTKAAVWEMKNYYPKAWASLQSGGSSETMIDSLVRNYEMPADKAGAIAARVRYLHGLKVGGPLAPTAATMPDDTAKRTVASRLPPPAPARADKAGAANGATEGRRTPKKDPLALSNWQLEPRTNVNVHNKTGSDVFIAASTWAT